MKFIKKIRILLFLLVFCSGCSVVQVHSDPVGADVYIDDQKSGYKTPAKIPVRNFTIGLHRIKVRKKGYVCITKPQDCDIALSVGNIIWSILLPPIVLVENICDDHWKGIRKPKRKLLDVFELKPVGSIQKKTTTQQNQQKTGLSLKQKQKIVKSAWVGPSGF